MSIPDGTPPRTMNELVDDALADVQAIIRHEKELAKAELKSSGIKAGVGAGLVGGALTLLFFASFPLTIAVAELFVRAGMARWGAYLLTWGISVVLAVVMVGIAILLFRRISPPRRTLAAAQETIAHLRGRAGAATTGATLDVGQPTAHSPGSTPGRPASAADSTVASSPAVKA